jgi:hypothetical protein
MADRARWKRLVPTAALTALPFTVMAPTAQAFFPPITPTAPVTVAPVQAPPFVPVTPPVIVPPVTPPPVIVVPPVTPPTGVPEPSTLVAAMAGLTAAAGWAARRRKRMKGESESAR